MNEDEEIAEQQALHEAIEKALEADGTLDVGDVLAGWIIVYETATLAGANRSSAGHFYGPREMTTWRAMGLVEWARLTLREATVDDEGDE